MIVNRILQLSIQYRVLIALLGVLLLAAGFYSAGRLPIDAVPDVTTNQVQINTVAPAFAPLEMERYITFPIEVALSNLPQRESIRSISQFGLSQVTVTFADKTDIYWARQMVLERLLEAREELPEGVIPEIAPISTGLGEIYQFTVDVAPDSPRPYSLQDLRTILDWQIKPELRTVPGIVEVNTFGGLEKQYEVRIDPQKLTAYRLSLQEVFQALRENNANAGGGYIEKAGEQQILRGVGLIQSAGDIESIVVSSRDGVPIHIHDIGTVGIGSEIRQGAATRDGKGETVIGMTMLLKGENSRTVTQRVKERIGQIQKSLPEGVTIRPFSDRSSLVEQTIRTAGRNLVEGGILVIAVLLLFLLQVRAGLIVSSAIPLSMLFAIIGMHAFGISANLMSLGAIDFGLIVDAAVIIVENCVRHLAEKRKELGRALTEEERIEAIRRGSAEVRTASQFGEMIIIAAYIPIVSLSGIEGKMFKPMAFTVILALSGALILSFTMVPALCALFLKDRAAERDNRYVVLLSRWYQSLLVRAIDHGRVLVGGVAALVVACSRLKSVALSESVRQTLLMEQAVKEMPEVETVVSRIGRPEIATDPMGPEMADTYVFLKNKSQWRPGVTKEELVGEMAEALEKVPGVVSSFSQPIKFRMMELIEGTGARSDVVIKIFGDDPDQLLRSANQAAAALGAVGGAADIKVQQTRGLPVLQIEIDRSLIARYGIDVEDVHSVIRSAVAGVHVGDIYEGFRKFDLVARFAQSAAADEERIGGLLVSGHQGELIPLRHLAAIESREGPSEISRENGSRLITVEANVRGRDIGSFVREARTAMEEKVPLPAGYTMKWGGTFEHLESGRDRLLVVVPLTFALIFLLLYTTFRSFRQAALVFTGIQFAITGGIVTLFLRDMHFSMSAGIGFIAVSGVAVLNGVVMITFINQLRARRPDVSLKDAVVAPCCACARC